MTEQEWLGRQEGRKMHDFLRVLGVHRRKAGKRKFRLLACACCRHVWRLLSVERGQRWVVWAERLADGIVEERQPPVTIEALRRSDADHAASNAAAKSVEPLYTSLLAQVSGALAAEASRLGIRNDPSRWLDPPGLLLEAFGNPFRPSKADPRWKKWNGGTIQRLAQDAYDERLQPDGR